MSRKGSEVWLGPRDVAQLAEYLQLGQWSTCLASRKSWVHSSPAPQNQEQVVHVCNPNIWEAEA